MRDVSLGFITQHLTKQIKAQMVSPAKVENDIN